MIRIPTLLLLFFLLTVNHSIYAQAPVVEWQKSYGGDDGDGANCIQQTSDGGYIVVGTSFSGHNTGDVLSHHGNGTVGDIWVLKIDVRGNIEWQRSLGATDQEDGVSVLQTTDGGYILGGSATVNYCEVPNKNHGEFDFWVLKLNSKGDIVWDKMYGGSKTDIAYAFSESTDGGYYVAGQSFSNDGDVKGNHGGSDYWVIKIDNAGKLIWQKSLGGSRDDIAKSIRSTPDGGCIIAGVEESADGDITGNHGIGDYWLVKLDKSGNTQWQKTYGGTGLDLLSSISLTNDGGYIAAGYSGSFDGDVTGRIGNIDTWIVKVDNAGNIQWQKCYGGTGNEEGGFIQLTSDGEYIVGVTTSSSNGDLTCNSGGGDAWVFKINNAGNLKWQKSFGGNGNDQINYILPLSDGSFMAAGSTASTDMAGYHLPGPINVDINDYWLIKLSAPQNSPPIPTITLIPVTGTVCSNNLTAIKAEASFAGLNPTFQWTRNGVPVGNNSSVFTSADFQENDLVSCTVTSGGPSCNNSGMTATTSLTIHINNNTINPTIHISADNTFLCNCMTNNFFAITGNAGPSPNYDWQINDQSTGGNLPTFSSNSLKLGDKITCVLSDKQSCIQGGYVISNPIQMTNNGDGITVNITASSDTICAGATVIFNATPVNGGANPVYQWRVNNINIGGNSSTFSSKSLLNGDQVSCLLSVTNACSTFNVVSNILTMKVGKSPTIIISPQDTLIRKGDQLKLNVFVTDSISSFEWSPSDKLQDPLLLSPTTIHLTDNITYTLMAKSQMGCIANKSITVKILSPILTSSLSMPNAFTPNGDGKNDVFRIPSGTSLRLEEFSIYDRWGARIFSTNSIDKGWDGTINGKQQPTGGYAYVIKGTSDKRIFLKGSFVLIR